MKVKEWKFKQLSKIEEIGFHHWKVLYDGEEIGTVRREAGYKTYRAISKAGRYIGSGSSKHEAKTFVAQDFVGVDNIEWKEV